MSIASRKAYINNLVLATLKQCKRIKEVTVKFRNGKYATAATTWQYETSHPTIIFSNHWIDRLTFAELRNLVLHECAHILSKEGHTKKFRKACCKIGVEKKWQEAYTNDVEVR
jgi:predicted metal-dependent hydrolase